MKLYTFIITFKKSGTAVISAFNKKEAGILAQAIMINKGMDYEIKKIIKY